MVQQSEPVTVSSERDALMAQVEDSTAGLCKEIPHLTVQRQQQLAYSDEEGAQKGRKVNEVPSARGLPPLGQREDATVLEETVLFVVCGHFLKINDAEIIFVKCYTGSDP